MSDVGLAIRYKQKFGAPGEVSSEEINVRMEGLDPYLDGYFVALAVERQENALSSSVSGMRVFVSYDEKIDYTRVELDVTIGLSAEAIQRKQRVQEDVTCAMNAFLDMRFPHESKE